MKKQTNKAIVAERRSQVARLYLQGVGQYQIADILDVNQSTISRDLKAIQKEWLDVAISNFDELKALELAKIDNLEVEYWDGWKRSKENKEVEIRKMVELGKGGKDDRGDARKEATKREEGQAGDPRFLQGIQWCINKRAEILGLNAPFRHDITSGGVSALDSWKQMAEQYLGSRDQSEEAGEID